MACNCNNIDYACMGEKTPTNCVIWSGDPIPALGICKGDVLTPMLNIIIQKVLELLEESETPVNVNMDNCLVMKQALAGRDKTVDNLFQILIDYQCTLKDLIAQVEAKIPTDTPYAFQLQCITPVGSPSNRDAIIQGLINEVCELATQVASLGTNIDQIINTKIGDYLTNSIKSLGNRGIQRTGSGANTTFTFLALVPPMCPIPYVGPLSNFDANGAGKVGTAFEGWYLLNGKANTLDGRGRALVASVAGVPGVPLDAAVDPAQPYNPGTNYTTGIKFGENFHKLLTPEIPAHTHAVNDPQHSHTSAATFQLRRVRCSTSTCESWWPGGAALNSGSAATGITLGSTGGNDIHETRQPSLAITGYIMRFD